jgi:hypothetical protein
MGDLLLARCGHAMHVHRSALHDVKSMCRIAFVEKIIILFQRLDNRDGGDVFQVSRRQPGEKLAAPQWIGDCECFKFGQRGHGLIQAVSRQK